MHMQIFKQKKHMQGKDTLPITTNAHVLQVANISHGQTTILMQKKKLQQSSEKPEKCLQGKKNGNICRKNVLVY